MNANKTILGTAAALSAFALTSVASTARADILPYDFSGSFGADDVSMSYDVGADLVYCSASELAADAAGDTKQECIPIPGLNVCFNVPEYDGCTVSATSIYAKASAYGTASLSVFGDSESIYVSPSVTTSDGSSSLNFQLTAFGTTLINSSASSIPFGYNPSFGAKKDFSVLGISVHVSAEASATLGGTLSGGAIQDGFSLTVDPTLSAGLDASADVSVACASAGIEGNIDLFDIELPSTLSVAYQNSALKYGIDSKFTYSALSGDMKIKACLCGDCTHKTIASYGGWSGGFTILDVSSSIPM